MQGLHAISNHVREGASHTGGALDACVSQHKQLGGSTGQAWDKEGVKKAHLSSLVK